MKLPFLNRNKPLKIEVAAGTDIGLKRANNEDSYLAIAGEESPDGLDAVIVVADGMGGHEAGEVASAMAIDSIRHNLTKRDLNSTLPSGGYCEILGGIIRNANSEIYEAGQTQGHGNMGTTCSALVKINNWLSIAHVGDSRIYLLRDGELRQITSDHSWVWEQVVAGNISEEEARNHPHKNVITRALGIASSVQVDVEEVKVTSGDKILVCSDGLNGPVEDAEIQSILAEHEIGKAKDMLIETAKQNGGDDNITVAIARVFN